MEIKELIAQIIADGDEWFPEVKDNIPHTALGLAEEAGEAAGVVKKYERYSIDWDGMQELLPEEVVDTVVYALKLCAQVGIDFEEAYHKKREINRQRFGHRGVRTEGRGNGTERT
jgi:NTP pyrophosphatase (non-canonical NTP hydrolase)